jgi:molecular chaperone GrpE
MSENQEERVQSHQETSAPQEPDLAARLVEAESQLAQYKDLLLRKAAEFENYKKRVENESAAIVKFATQELIVELLPILDDLERSLKISKERKDFESFYKGVELIHQKMVKVLSDQGIKSMDTVGKEFNVEYHDALMQIPRDDVPPYTILEEVEKGYTLHDKVIRHAKVIVSAAPVLDESTEKATTAAPSDDHQDSRT